jgi:hypothetical protein
MLWYGHGSTSATAWSQKQWGISRVVAGIHIEYGIIVYNFQAHVDFRSRDGDFLVCYNHLD